MLSAKKGWLTKMSSKYTYKDAKQAIDTINLLLQEKGIKRAYKIQKRYGYTALDLQTGANIGTFCADRTIATGTPQHVVDMAWRDIGQDFLMGIL